MRAEFASLVNSYPGSPKWRDSAFAGSPVVALLEEKLPAAIVKAIPKINGRYKIDGSAGQGGWTHTPWVSLLDPAVTTSVEEGFYCVYLLSRGGNRLYLIIGQGCTTLKKSIGIRSAKDELRRRADLMWSRIRYSTNRLQRIAVDLNVESSVWRGKLYEAGLVAGIQYDTANLPDEETLVADLNEALALYRLLNQSGGWEADDDIIRDAETDGVGGSLEQAKRYRQHRAIERQQSHSRLVKKNLGTRCMGCSFELSELYGSVASGFIEAHHLIPLSNLHENEIIRFDPKKDFAVLCPNCHRVIHRMNDVSDLNGLRKLVKKGLLAELLSNHTVTQA
jgi:5-methylcytosine-specific restriction protein A